MPPRENGRGWLGIRFQARPHVEPSQIIIHHARLVDSTAAREQEALGALGVNLIHGAFFQRRTGRAHPIADGRPLESSATRLPSMVS
jgi:hypothetical protein